MPWTLDYRSPNDLELLNEFCLVVGRSLCLASNFEGKCRYVHGTIFLVDQLEAGNDFDGASALAETLKLDTSPLQRIVEVVGKRATTLEDNLAILINAKNSRNFIAHQAAQIGPVSSVSDRSLVKAAFDLLPHVIRVAVGDNLVSKWCYEINEKEPAPEGIQETYQTKVVEWVYSDTAFRFILSQSDADAGASADGP